MQPFGSQPATSFVFWLKAHNKPGKTPVYSVAQIVSQLLFLHPGAGVKLTVVRLVE
jgi:hypothetical protein